MCFEVTVNRFFYRKWNENSSLKCWNRNSARRRPCGPWWRQAGARPGLRHQATEAERCAPAGRAAGFMTLFHFWNCFALAYFPYSTTYKYSGLSPVPSGSVSSPGSPTCSCSCARCCSWSLSFPPGKAASVTSLGSS